MHTHAQKQSPAQKKDAPTAASILDTSSQSESLQRKADLANNATQRAEAPRPNNTGMPDNLKSGIESLSGFSMDDVRVHYNSSKPATVQALAYTQGTDIHVAPGQEKCLPHEAWHVAQQMAGRVSPTTNINGMPVNDNAALEHEADVMGEKAVQCKSVEYESPFSLKRNNVGSVSAQRKIKVGELDNFDDIKNAIRDKYQGNKLIDVLDKNVLSKMPDKIMLDFFKTDTVNGTLENFDTTFEQWLVEWNAFEKGTYEYTNDETGLFKLVKDVFKYHFFKHYGWRIIGVGEYMTGDSTGLGIAAALDPTITLKILPYWASQTEKTPTFMEGGALDPTKTDVRFKDGIRSEDSLARKCAPVLFKPLYDSSQVRISRTGLNKWKTTYAAFKEKKKKKMLSQEYSKDEKIVDDLKSLSVLDVNKLREKINEANIIEELKNQQQQQEKQIELQQEKQIELQQQIKGISQELQKLQQEREKQKGLQQEQPQEQEKQKELQQKELQQKELQQKKLQLIESNKKLPKKEQIVTVPFEKDVVANALCCIRHYVDYPVKITGYTKAFYNKSKEEIKNALISIKLKTLSLNESQKKEIKDEFKLIDPRNADVIYKRRFVAEGRSDEYGPIKPWNGETWWATDIIGKKYIEKKEKIETLLLPSEQSVKDKVSKFKTELFTKKGIDANAKCILLWQRMSGQKGGAHKELDSHPIVLKRIAQMISANFNERVIILIGDDSMHESDLRSCGVTNKIAEFNEYWNDPDFMDLKVDRNNQNYFLQLLSKQNDAISIGMRSGSLESSALLGIKTIFIDDLGNNAEDRMEFWAGNAAYGRKNHLIDESFEGNLSGPIPNYKRLATSNCFTTSERDVFKYLDAIEYIEDTKKNLMKNFSDEFFGSVVFAEDDFAHDIELIFSEFKEKKIKERCSEIADQVSQGQEHVRIGEEYISIGEEEIEKGQREVGKENIRLGQDEIALGLELIENEKKISRLRQDENDAYTIVSKSLKNLLWKLEQTQGLLLLDCKSMLEKLDEFRKYLEEWVISDNELDQLAGLLSFWIKPENKSAVEGSDKENHVDVTEACVSQNTDIVKQTES